MRKRTAFVCGVVLAGMLVSVSALVYAVPATGTGTSEAAGESGKRAAVKAALKAACDGACSDFLNRQRPTPAFEKVLERVLADPSGYTSDLRAETTHDTTAGWTATVSADVSPERFARVWKATYVKVTSPRLMVTVTETRDGTKQDVSIVGAGIAKYLLRRGFRMVDKAQFDEVKEQRLKEAALSDDLTSAASIARDVGADLFVVGEVRADKGQEEEIGGIKFQFYTAEASVKVVQADSAGLVASERAKGRGASRNANTAATKALEQCGGQIAAKIWRACLHNWDRVIPSSIRCELRVTGITAEGVLTLEKELKKVKGVTSVKLRDMRGGTAQFTIVTPLNAKKLFTALVGSDAVKNLIEVTGITNKVIRARWKEEIF